MRLSYEKRIYANAYEPCAVTYCRVSGNEYGASAAQFVKQVQMKWSNTTGITRMRLRLSVVRALSVGED